MRPIDRGDIPLDNKGKPKVVSEYTYWRADLLDRLGDYCSYCEMPVTHSIEVEHIQPKSLEPLLRLEWTNLLISCGSCNRKKSDTPVDSKAFYLPDECNTIKHFIYQAKDNTKPVSLDNPVIPKSKNNSDTITTATINLFGLDIIKKDNKATDIRWRKRTEAFLMCEEVFSIYNESAKRDNDIKQVIFIASSRGFFSIWFNKFSTDRNIRKKLIESFKGTNKNCFDSNYNPI